VRDYCVGPCLNEPQPLVRCAHPDSRIWATHRLRRYGRRGSVIAGKSRNNHCLCGLELALQSLEGDTIDLVDQLFRDGGELLD
jgi:hypothetical protein